MSIKGEIPKQDVDKALNRIKGSYQPQTPAGTGLGTLSAAGALLPVDTPGEVRVYGAFRADVLTLITAYTCGLEKGDFSPVILGFRIVAVDTAKRASLKKDHASNPGTVVHAVSLYINDKR